MSPDATAILAAVALGIALADLLLLAVLSPLLIAWFRDRREFRRIAKHWKQSAEAYSTIVLPEEPKQ